MAARSSSPDFVHLRTHSHYSLLSSTCRIPELVQAAVADGQPALGLTDNGNLFGAVEFYKACKRAGIRPVLGMTAYCARRSRLQPSGSDNPTYHLPLLAENDEGWDHLKRLSSLAYLEGFHYRPRIDRELLDRYRGGLIAFSGGLQGEIGQHLAANRFDEALRTAGELADVFGRDGFFLELHHAGSQQQARVNEALLRIRDKLGLAVVATNDVHYLSREDRIALDILLCIRNGKTISDPGRQRTSSGELWFKTRARMAKEFADLPEALAATIAVAERCKVHIDFETYHLPVFDTGSDETPDEMFERLCELGVRQRYDRVTPEIRERLETEKAVIRKLGFVSYFLITADFIRHAREHGIPVGPGRGSAAGSIVAYALHITDLDPLRYGLIFERFLNVDRVSMPDIDIDFCGERRDEVIDYVRRKYGEQNVCQIITFGTMASRGVLRDVGRVLELPLGEVDKIAKKVPQGPGASLRKALENDKELASLRESNDQLRRLFELGLKLEGLARHTSVHAAGMVIADRPLIDYVPLARSGQEITTQWQMTELEEVGLLKVDFLGLKTLTILAEATRLIREARGADLDLDNLPLDDAETYELMARGDTLGVFQLESPGMRDLLARLRPDNFEDVIAVLALYRPGPLNSGMADMFARRKHGGEEITYPHDSLRPILESTYGVIVYQEQVMFIANILAGFSMNQADSLRKAMAKKKPEVMAKFKDLFIEGAVQRGHDARFARELFETLEYFAGYGFNRSHSAAYALLTYRTAYLKCHYPVEFLAANLTVESDHSDKVKEFVDAARRSGIEVLPCDVNASLREFTVEGDAIRFGLGAIKGVGHRAADAIAQERRSKGPYSSLEDLCERVDPSLVNKTTLEALARAGAFDSLGVTRRGAFESIDSAIRASAATREDRRRGQGLLFGVPIETNSQTASVTLEWNEPERLSNEKLALGFYFSGHPFARRGQFFARIAGHTSADLADASKDEVLRIAGMIADVRVLQVRSGRNKGEKMARFRLEDLQGSAHVACFAKEYAVYHKLIEEDAIVFVEGRVAVNGEEHTLVARSIKTWQEVVAVEVSGIVLALDQETAQPHMLDRIAEIVERHPGDQRLLFTIQEQGRRTLVRSDRRYAVRVDDGLLDELSNLVGPERLFFTRV